VNPTDAQVLTFTPSSAGDYIWMVNGFYHEGPGGGSSGGLFAEDETGTDRQNTEESYIGGTDRFVPLIHFERRNLSASSKTFVIRSQPDTSNGSERQGLTQLLFRADVFGATEVASSPSVESTSSVTYVTKNTLTTGSVPSDHDYVYLVVMGSDNESYKDINVSNFTEIRLGGMQQLEEEIALNRWYYDRQIAWAHAETCRGNRMIDTRYRNEAGGTKGTIVQNAHILSLRYIEPDISLGAE
jgi:hypothetical protein